AAFFLHNYLTVGSIYTYEASTGEEVMVVSGLEALRTLSRAEGWIVAHLRKAQNKEYGASTTLVSADGEQHRQLRQLQSWGYSRKRSEGSLGKIVCLASEAFYSLEAKQPIAVRDLLLPLVARAIGIAFLDYDIEHRSTSLALFRNCSKGYPLQSSANKCS